MRRHLFTLRGALATVATLLLALALPVVLPPGTARAANTPVVVALPASAKPGATTTVGGSGWPAHVLLTVLLCGQNAVAGTDDCANASGRAVTTDAAGRFTEPLTVQLPPEPCPCVIHVSTVLGGSTSTDTPFDVIGAPVKPIPVDAAGSGHLIALSESLTGDSNLLNVFGAPPSRTLKVIVTNLGAAPVVNPEFRLGTSHSVLAPEWSAAPWQGVIQPGQKVEVDLPVEFDSGASGRWTVALSYQGKQDFATAYEDLPAAWGVTLFWFLLGLVVAVGLYRIGMAVLDRVRPDVVERHRERRLSRLGRHRAGADVIGPVEEGSGEDEAADEAPTQVIPLVPPPPPLPMSSPAQPASPTAVSPQPAPPMPAYAPTVRPALPAAPAAPTLPWFAPGTVTLTAPPQAAPLVRPPQAERPTDT
ncbi:hypothetical protein [Streptacidiphilus jiangxiensis]|uniref:Neocarzinostatin family protein n=1 Tax=Streptacidiphilus jiangxiensis TaxID=235985 RepID=A0A1H7YPB5_STRJI|nr:hypothetical protein [Streptacidiphilus jiangxiensis]SEM48086.1 hypothetical protein SAMN05414137_1308 [Streptacidiphilus jiangxiensis]